MGAPKALGVRDRQEVLYKITCVNARCNSLEKYSSSLSLKWIGGEGLNYL